MKTRKGASVLLEQTASGISVFAVDLGGISIVQSTPGKRDCIITLVASDAKVVADAILKAAVPVPPSRPK